MTWSRETKTGVSRESAPSMEATVSKKSYSEVIQRDFLLLNLLVLHILFFLLNACALFISSAVALLNLVKFMINILIEKVEDP